MVNFQLYFRILNYSQNLNLNLEEIETMVNQFLEFWTIHKIWIWTWKRVKINFKNFELFTKFDFELGRGSTLISNQFLAFWTPNKVNLNNGPQNLNLNLEKGQL